MLGGWLFKPEQVRVINWVETAGMKEVRKVSQIVRRSVQFLKLGGLDKSYKNFVTNSNVKEVVWI